LGVASTKGCGNTKIGCLKAGLRLAFKQPIFIMRIASRASRRISSWVFAMD
jgi:hypothetical protein